MFKAVLNNVSVLKNSIAAIAQIIDEAVFKFKPEGIELVAADRAKVAAVDFKLRKEAFDSYTCDKEMNVGLNLANFLKVMKRVNKTDTLEIEVDEKENRVKLKAIGRSTRVFYLPILDLSEEELPPIEKLQFTAKVTLDTDTVKQGIQDADTVADSVVFQTTANEFVMHAEGDSSRVELRLDSTQAEIEGEAKARYPIDYLKKFMKASGLTDTITIHFGTDYPMKMEFNEGSVYLALILAPRVEE
jgi:proliferating cell nuclear antigen